MYKKIFAVFFLLIVLAIGGQCTFWFFKTSQLEKQLTKYTTDKDSFVVISAFEISGFPLQQDVTIRDIKIKLPESISKGSEVTLQKVSLSSSIFSNIFKAKILEDVILSNATNGRNDVEFDQAPTAELQIGSQGIVNFSYKDKGYKILGPNKDLVTSSGPNDINFSVETNESGQVIYRIKGFSKNTDNFDIINFYKNHYESKIVDGIKTGKIQIGLKELEQKEAQRIEQAKEGDTEKSIKNLSEFNNSISPKDLNEEFEKQMAAKNEAKTLDIKSKTISEEEEEEYQDDEVTRTQTDSQEIELDEESEEEMEEIEEENSPNEALIQQKVDESNANKPTTPKSDNPTKKIDETTKKEPLPLEKSPTKELIIDPLSENKKKEDAKLLDLDKELAENSSEKDSVKNNVEIDIEYILTPIESSESGKVTDPTKITQIVVNYNKSYKINKFKIDNSNFTININGQLDRPRDDTNISGFVTLKIDKVDTFIDFVKSSSMTIANENGSQIKSFDPSYSSEIVKNAYPSFLSSISEKLSKVMIEISAKNQLSQDQTMVFDIRKEKNLDIIINETSMREIVGKF